MRFTAGLLAAMLVLGSAAAASEQTLTFDLMNNLDDRLTSLKVLDGELFDFTPLDTGETGVFRVESSNGTCDVRVRARFKRGAIIETKVYLCDPRGKAFSQHGNRFQIVFRDQLGL